MAHNPVEWLRIHGSSPLAEIDPNTPYLKEISEDGGRTWIEPRPSSAEHAQLTEADARAAGRHVTYRGPVITIESPYPTGGLIRYTPDKGQLA